MTDLTNGNDNYTGGNGDDIINALDGDDIVHGAGGDDQINGGSGADTLYGDQGDDQLNGGSDNDTLVGGTGNDILIGGSGTDTAVINADGANGIGSHNGATLTVTTSDGVDALQQIEFIQFNNGTVAVVNGNANAFLGADTASITQQGTASGNVQANDFDIDDTMAVTAIHSNNANTDGTLGTGLHGGYGTLTLNADGTYSYAADASTNTLGVGESAVDTFTYTVHSGGSDFTQTLTITINGTNDAPSITSSVQSPVYNDTLNNDSFTTFTGSLTASDVDAHDTLTYGATGASADNSQSGFDTSVAGTYGTLYINSATGAYEYVPNDAAIEALKTTASDSFTFTVSDGHGGSDSQGFTVTLNGVNDKPTLGVISPMSYQDTTFDDIFATQTGTLNGADRDNDTLTYHATAESSDVSQSGFDHSVAGTYGTLYFNASTGAYEYVANDGAIEGLKTTASETFSFTASDGSLSSIAQTLTVTLNGVNDTPDIVASAPTTELTESGGVNNGTLGTLTASSTMTLSDRDTGDTPTFDSAALSTNGWVNDGGGIWHKIGTYGTATLDTSNGHVTYGLNDNDSDTQALQNGDTVHDVFTLYVTDGTAGNSTTVDFTIHGTNDNAVVSGALSGSGTEAGGVNNGTAGSAASGTATDTDVDNTANTFQAVTNGSTNNHYGTFSIDTSGNWVYTVNDSNASVQALNVGGTLHDTFTITTLDGTTQTVTVTINGANDAAVVGGQLAGNAREAGGVNNASPGMKAAGTAADTDVDNPNNAFQAVNVAQASDHGYGTWLLATGGHWVFTVDDNNATVQALNVGQSLTDTFTIHTIDGTAQTVTVTINGANDAAVIGGALSGSGTEAGGVNNGTAGSPASGTATDTDVDNTANTFQAVSGGATTNHYGTFSIDASGNWVYTVDDNNASVQALNVGGSLTDTFTIHSQDGTAQTVTVTINGANDAAVVSGTLSGAATEAGGVNNGTAGSTASGTATDTDVDNTANTFQAVSNGATTNSYGTFSIDAGGHWVYTVDDNNASVQALNVGGSLSDTFTITTQDGTTQTVTVTINGANDAAVIGGVLSGNAVEAGGVNNGNAGSAASGTATDTDVDNPANTFQAVSNGATTNQYGTFSIDASGNWVFTVDDSNATVQALNVGGSLSDTFTIHSQDGTAQTVTVTIFGANDAAVVSGTLSGAATEAGGVNNGIAGSTASGTATDSDVDDPANTFQTATNAATTNGYGTFSIDSSGHWVYAIDDNNSSVQALNVGGTLTDTFTIHTSDGTAQLITVTINGANDAAVIGGTLSGTAQEAGGANNSVAGFAASGTATDTDVDNPVNTFQVVSGGSTAHNYGTFAIDAGGNWVYTVNESNATVQALNVGGTLHDSFTITTQDGTTQTVTVTINGANDAAVVTGDLTGSVTESNGVSGTSQANGNLVSTDPDNNNKFQSVNTQTVTDHGYGTYTISSTGHWIFNLKDTNTAVQALDDGQTLTETFTVHTTDGTAQVVSVVIHGQNEIFTGTAGADTMKGTIYGDTMTGLGGDDTYIINETHDTIVEQPGGGTDTALASVTYTLNANVESLLQQGSSNIDGTGNDLANQIVGNAGNNVLSGAGGDDVIKGGAGNDTLNGGLGDDNMDGGAGVDTVTYADASGPVTVSLAVTSFQNTGGAGFDKIANVENITGSNFDDTLTGSSVRNVITGGGGADTMTGGGSADTFVYKSVGDSAVGHSDTITDLVNGDAIDFSALGNDFHIVGSFDHHADEITVSYNSTTHLTTISVDTNGDGTADMQILANGDHHTFANFIGLGP